MFFSPNYSHPLRKSHILNSHKEWQGVIRPHVEEGRIFVERQLAAREERDVDGFFLKMQIGWGCFWLADLRVLSIGRLFWCWE
jgi:hypothetical protein